MTADTVGGVWTYAIELSRALEKHGVEVGLATMGARMNLAQKAEAAALPNLKVFESCFKLEWMEDPRADVERAGNWLLELESSFRPDLVHLNSYSHGAFPWHSPKIIVGHSCVLSWWRAVHGCDAPAEWDEYRESVMAGLHGAELVIAPSNSMMASLVEHYGPFKASAVIYNGRRFAALQHHVRHDFIFTAGRLWDAGKNITTLADIAANLPWPIMIAGQESDPDGRSNPIKNLSCVGQLTSNEMADCLGRASIYALPARYESFGISVLEAALAGCALVLGDIPSLREIWGDAALFVNPEDSAHLEHTLKDLIKDREQITRLAAAAQKHAQQFTPERMAEEYLNAYTQVLRSHAPIRPAAQPHRVESAFTGRDQATTVAGLH
jgi:glycosyltransferase involved in cell wall biosynthesis